MKNVSETNSSSQSDFAYDATWFSQLTLHAAQSINGIDHYRGHDAATGVTWRISSSSMEAVDATLSLRNEYLVASRLNDGWAEVPLALIDLDRRVALVFPEREGRPLDGAGDMEPVSVTDFLKIATGAASALSQMHRSGLLHRAIQPANMIVDADGRVRFSSFGLAVRLDEAAPSSAFVPTLEAMAYAAPEQARRDEPGSDCRSDLYALGVVLYELVTGQLPLRADSVAQWLHAHVAIEAARPGTLRSGIPTVIEEIILRLIAKDPAARYQSALALHADLLRCQDAWAAGGAIAPFVLGRADLPRQASPSRNLIGRSAELAMLAEAFGRVRQTGESEIIFVTGAPGAGKSALVDRLPGLVEPSGIHFAAGKSDLLQKDIPYAPFAQILKSLVARLLSESGAALDLVREHLVAALGGYGRLLADLVPETEFVIGPGLSLPEVPIALAQARMIRVILQTLSAFATETAPLALFLDDLQWADASTLAVVKAFVEHAPGRTLLIIAYRDEEAGHGDEFTELLGFARSGSSRVTDIAVRQLTLQDTSQLVASSLGDTPDDVAALAEMVHRKTGGNAFYISQFLRTLVDEHTVTFDLALQRWVWNEERTVHHHDVAEFMVRRLDALPPARRDFLRLLACAGGQCETRLFARIACLSPTELEQVALPLLDAGLLLRRGVNFAIAHDRVLEAAYALTAEDDRPVEHARIARLMVEAHGDDLTKAAFEVAHQIERAATDDLSQSDRLSFVQVLLAAARRARDAVSVEQAAGYLRTARALAGPVLRSQQYALVFEMEFLHCECLIALARIEEASAAIEALLAFARRPADKADVYRLKAVTHTVRSDYQEAIDAALAGLSLLGVVLQRSPTAAECDAAFQMVRRRLAECTLARFVDLPEMQDGETRSAVALLSTLSSSFFVEGGLSFLHTAKIVELTLHHGMTPESAYGLAWFGVFGASLYEAYEDGFAYGLAALKIAQRDGYEAQRTATLVAVDQVSPWTQPLHYALERAREAVTVGYAAGDLGMTCYARNHIGSDLIVLGAHLAVVQGEIEQGISLTQQIKYKDVEYILEGQMLFVETLQSGHYLGARTVSARPIRSIPTLFWAALYEGMTAYFFGDHESATRFMETAMALSWSAPAHIDVAYSNLFAALALARRASADKTPDAAIDRLGVHRARFARWSDLNPATFHNKLLLIDAEMARLRGEHLAALNGYEQAARAAEAAGFVHEQALAHELACAFCATLGLTTSAQGHFRAARACYRRWGAHGKARQLEAAHAELSDDTPAFSPAPPDFGQAPPDLGQAELNLAVVMKAAQALSEEILLDRVVETLMTDMVVHAGAQYGLLILMRDEEPVIEATARVTRRDVVVHIAQALPTPQAIPLSVLNTVIRTKKSARFADAFVEAPHLRQGGPLDRPVRSLICLPLIKRGTLVGVLYLENNLAPGVFTANRTAMLEILAPQAAISLDAARLYKELAEENTRRSQTETALQQARADLTRTSHLTVMGGLAASIAHEINQPLASVVSNADASLRWLRRPQPDLDEVNAGLENIRGSGLRAAGIVKALRSLAKQAPTAFVPVDLNETICEVLRLTSVELGAQHVRVETRLDPDLGTVPADPVQLQQVVLNLVTNAADAMSALAPDERELVVESVREDRSILVRVHDKGSGMAPETLQRIFDPFFTTKASGMGMGLAICRSIVEAHGGTLQATSVAGRGSIFFFRLNVAE